MGELKLLEAPLGEAQGKAVEGTKNSLDFSPLQQVWKFDGDDKKADHNSGELPPHTFCEITLPTRV